MYETWNYISICIYIYLIHSTLYYIGLRLYLWRHLHVCRAISQRRCDNSTTNDREEIIGITDHKKSQTDVTVAKPYSIRALLLYTLFLLTPFEQSLFVQAFPTPTPSQPLCALPHQNQLLGQRPLQPAFATQAPSSFHELPLSQA